MKCSRGERQAFSGGGGGDGDHEGADAGANSAAIQRASECCRCRLASLRYFLRLTCARWRTEIRRPRPLPKFEGATLKRERGAEFEKANTQICACPEASGRLESEFAKPSGIELKRSERERAVRNQVQYLLRERCAALEHAPELGVLEITRRATRRVHSTQVRGARVGI